tara:strand:+ start:22 stop:342 length:321 start_codon:yes stop_codon:yes gene_type:complete
MEISIKNISELLENENIETSNENILNRVIKGGKHAFDIIIYLYNMEIDKYKKRIQDLEQENQILKKSNNEFYCKICELNCNSKKALDEHLNGKKHINNIKKKNKNT